MLTSVYMFGWILKSTETPGMSSNQRSRLDHFWADSLRGSKITPKLKIVVEFSPNVKRLGRGSAANDAIVRDPTHVWSPSRSRYPRRRKRGCAFIRADWSGSGSWAVEMTEAAIATISA